MAGIKSLAVRGIRSFGPEDNDEQRISFERPLTLILGQNGCGKTTIIECVRYALTGQMPPGSRNDCFVHDAKVNRTTEVLGQVKLKIVNAKDEQLEIARSMRVTALQKKKSKFQTLDSFLSVIDEKGKTKDISSRCADLDSMMYEQLGVSKAIMNSVIFCHQEDSSWPLDEGKKVKERFDEIFEADKYSDCFDRLRKIRKEYETEIKVLEQKVANLTDKKENLDKKKLDVVNTESQISEAEIRVAELEQEIKPLSEKIKAIETLQKNLVTIETKREKIKTKLEHFTTQEQELKSAITNLFEGSQADLEKNISNYATTAKTKKEDLDNSYKQNNKFNIEEEKIANEKTSNEMKFKELILLESQNQDKIDKKNTMIANTAKLAEIEIEKIESNEDAVKAEEAIKNKIKSLQTELSDKKREADTEENKLQADVDTCRDALSRHKQKISNKESEIQNVKKEITKVEKGITDTNKSKVRLEFLEKKMTTAEEDYQEVVNELNTEECQKSINEDEATMEKSEQELEELNEKINQLQKQSAKLKERDMIEDSLKQKEKQMNVLKNKHRSVISELLGEMPDKGYAMAINKLEYELRTEVDSVKKKLKEKDTSLTSLETERKHVRELLTERRNELTEAEDQMFKACGTQTYEATLNKLNTTVEKLQEEQNMLQSSMFIFTKYKNQLKDNSCCPLCNRGFDSDSEASDLISQLTTQVMNVPAKQEKVSEELQRTSAKRDDLLSMKSLNEKIKTLKEKDVPQLETRLKDVDTQIAKLTEESEELSMTIMEPEQKLQNARQILSDMPLLDRYTNEVTTATKDVQELVNLQENLKQLESNREKALVELKELQDATAPLELDLKEKEKIKTECVKKNRAAIDVKNDYITKIKNAFDKVKSIEMEIKQHKERNVQAEMDKIKEANERLMDKQKQIMVDRDTLTKKIDSLKDELAKQDIYKRNLEDNLKLRKAQTEIANSESELAALNEKLSGVNMDMISEKEPLMAKHEDLFKEKLQTEGLLRGYKERLKQCKMELKKAVNEGIEKQYREKYYDLHVIKALEKDIKDYSVALEKCLMEFHKEKMENINLIIREMWRKIYRGNDIDYIEIKTEGSATSDSDRRKYDYRVVQCKNGVEIDMRGRCSAGQKVLACLIIRLALAETFSTRVVQCKNGVEIDMRGRCSAGQKVLACLIIRLALAETFSTRFGILALDEPTTNLDQENVKSLCEALGEIVLERMAQKNFMFIIITHDREFIESLGSIDKVTHFYEVSRNEEGKSRIKKIRFT
ncbi:DNA repair protein RAD50 [Papilio machaon]|uniref:DNA repair protein RAD50 n=1 Tax=Papilio machaon TaxID=76193 RepID=A0A194RCL8_PAPMA|nr:DNA repair protein RAD50 [Papilio machaon]